MITLDFLAEGIRQVNLAFIENPNLNQENYPPMIVQYLISTLLIATRQKDTGFGFYTDPAVGYTGWLTIGKQTLFFAPTKAVILDTPDAQYFDGELSPYGEI